MNLISWHRKCKNVSIDLKYTRLWFEKNFKLEKLNIDVVLLQKSHEKVTFLPWKCLVMLIWHDRYFNMCVLIQSLYFCVFEALSVQRVIPLPVVHSPRDKCSWVTSWRHQTPSPYLHPETPRADLKTHTHFIIYFSTPYFTSKCQCLLFSVKKNVYWPTALMGNIFLSVQQTGRRQLVSNLDVKNVREIQSKRECRGGENRR